MLPLGGRDRGRVTLIEEVEGPARRSSDEQNGNGKLGDVGHGNQSRVGVSVCSRHIDIVLHDIEPSRDDESGRRAFELQQLLEDL